MPVTFTSVASVNCSLPDNITVKPVERARIRNTPPSEGKAKGARRDPRRAVELRAFARLGDDKSIELTILDLSYDGCRVEAPVAFLPKTQLKLSVPRLGELSAEVRWCDGNIAGLCFTTEALEPAQPQKPRSHERVTIDGQISLRRPGRQQFQGRVFDMTPSGCKVEFIERPKVGDIIWAKFQGLDALEAEVRWVDGYYGGVEFKRPIYAAVFDLLLVRIGKL
jgi:hypothetical protein